MQASVSDAACANIFLFLSVSYMLRVIHMSICLTCTQIHMQKWKKCKSASYMSCAIHIWKSDYTQFYYFLALKPELKLKSIFPLFCWYLRLWNYDDDISCMPLFSHAGRSQLTAGMELQHISLVQKAISSTHIKNYIDILDTSIYICLALGHVIFTMWHFYLSNGHNKSKARKVSNV